MKKRQYHRAIVLIAISAVLSLGYWSARFMWADVQAMPARHAMAKWEKALAVEKIDEIDKAITRMHTAFELNPLSADYAMDLGRLYEWQALQRPRWTKHAHQFRARAIHYFRKATQLRPSWGFAWVHLAQSKVINQELDSETTAALEKAMVLAPWEIGVQSKVVSLGFTLWPYLSEDMQQQLSRTLQRAVQLQPHAMIKLAVKQNWVARLRPLLGDERHLNYLARLQRSQNRE